MVVSGPQEAVAVLHHLIAANAKPLSRIEGGPQLARTNVAGAHVTAAAAGADRLKPLERLLDRCAVIGCMGEEELDSLNTKSSQAARELLSDKGGVKAAACAIGAGRGNLGSKADSVGHRRGALGQPPADHGLARTTAINLRCVEQRDAKTNRLVHRRERRRLSQATAHELRAPAHPAEHAATEHELSVGPHWWRSHLRTVASGCRRWSALNVMTSATPLRHSRGPCILTYVLLSYV